MRSLLLLLALCGATRALFVCPPNFCARVRCAAVTAESCVGRVAQKGGVCGCCDICVDQIKEGESCMTTMLLGSPLKSECANGLYCDRNSAKCVKKTCAMRRQEVQARLEAARAAGSPLLGLEAPGCAADGTYLAKQCRGSRCFCVSAEGESIQTYGANRWEAADMDCACARDFHEYQKKGIIGMLFKCDALGSYSEVQCTGSVCYCADKNGTQLLGMSGVHISRQQGLNCKKAACAKKYSTVKAQLDKANAAGTPLLGLELPKCAQDGTYLAKQCRGSQCMCVEEGGKTLGSYTANRWEADNMDCNCARDEYAFAQTGLLGRQFSCDARGSYTSVQCLGSSCYCVDVSGKRLMATQAVHVSQMASLKC